MDEDWPTKLPRAAGYAVTYLTSSFNFCYSSNITAQFRAEMSCDALLQRGMLVNRTTWSQECCIKS